MQSRSRQLMWVFRILVAGAAMEFLGHGMLGISGVASWTRYFAVVGISRETALRLMPLVGVFDVALALLIIASPFRAAVLWMAAWGLWTALLRPLSGESAWEAVERSGNFGPLIALFLMAKAGGAASWLRFDIAGALEGRVRSGISWILRMTTVLLLLGHGALGVFDGKPLHGADLVGLSGPWGCPLIGGLECALALAVLLVPGRGLLLAVLAWKVATEGLAPISGSPIWVFIEHGGSYCAPLALSLLVRRPGEAAAPLSLRGLPA